MHSNLAIRTVSARPTLAGAQSMPDEVLLQNIAAGQKTAMHVLYARHNLRAYRFVLRIVGDVSTAEDIVSQVFLDVWRTAGQFEGRSQVSTWILAIARFKALTALRNRQHEDLDQDEVQAIADTAAGPQAHLEQNETAALLRQAIGKLSAAHREIIDLVYYHEKSVEEVSLIVGVPANTVKTRMFYARKHLAELLKGSGIERLAA